MLERSRSTCLDSEKICFAYDSILNDIIYLFIQHIDTTQRKIMTLIIFKADFALYINLYNKSN